MGAETPGAKKIIYYLFMGAVLILSVINIVMFVALLNVKQQISDGAKHAADAVKQMQAQPLTDPFTANIAIDNTFSVPIKIVIPIKTTINVPVTIPTTDQQVTIAIPIDTSVPIDTTIQVPVKTTIPVSIKVGDLPFGDILQQLHDWLIKLSTSL
ncbi:MAG: hypothetical protein WC845_03690 [Candidatus Staskawiczbacteria bacterium]|jgi:hypothetical protein